MSDLKPCPFCGGDRIGVAFGIAGCRECLGQVVRDHNDQATEGWNRRAPSEETGPALSAREREFYETALKWGDWYNRNFTNEENWSEEEAELIRVYRALGDEGGTG